MQLKRLITPVLEGSMKALKKRSVEKISNTNTIINYCCIGVSLTVKFRFFDTQCVKSRKLQTTAVAFNNVGKITALFKTCLAVFNNALEYFLLELHHQFISCEIKNADNLFLSSWTVSWIP